MDLLDKRVKILELDAILDTRLTIYKEQGVDVDDIFQQGYRNRVYDRFPGVDYEAYMDRYKNRDNDLLLAATVTELPYLLASNGAKTHDVRDAMGLNTINEIWINTYPYDLNESQQFEIGRAVSTIMKGSGYNIRMVHHTYKEMSLQWMKSKHVTDFYIYQYEEWLNVHSEIFNIKTKQYGITITSPWLITAELTDEVSNYLDDMIRSGIQPVKLLKGHFALWFILELTRSRYFSSILADDIYPDYVDPPNISS